MINSKGEDLIWIRDGIDEYGICHECGKQSIWKKNKGGTSLWFGKCLDLTYRPVCTHELEEILARCPGLEKWMDPSKVLFQAIEKDDEFGFEPRKDRYLSTRDSLAVEDSGASRRE